MDAESLCTERGLPAGVPVAVLPVARRLRGQAMRALGQQLESDERVETATLLDELLLPLRVEPDWPGPMAPQRVLGGWVQADVTDDDLDTLHQLRELLPDADPETFAATAQQWRLPVLPYRRLAPLGRPAFPSPAEPQAEPQTQVRMEVNGLRVLDLTALWAGPFATALLADNGAEVVKIDPDCRPDGFGERPNLYTALNRNKEIYSLDLRVGHDRSEFVQLVQWADVLISSFSRRVLPNLGFDAEALRRLNPRLRTVAIVGFPSGSPESEWLAYGTGIHAMSGLGLIGEVAQAAPIAYPDPLTGYLAVSAVLSGVSTEVSLSLAGQLVAGEALLQTSNRP